MHINPWVDRPPLFGVTDWIFLPTKVDVPYGGRSIRWKCRWLPMDVLTHATEHPHFALVDVKSLDASYRWTKCKVNIPLVAR